MTKWGRAYWADLAERVGSVFVYSLITYITTVQTTTLDWSQAWAIVVLPTVLSLLKGLGANMKNPESGPSLLSPPPGPVERGQSSLIVAVLVVLVVVVILLLIFPAIRH